MLQASNIGMQHTDILGCSAGHGADIGDNLLIIAIV